MVSGQWSVVSCQLSVVSGQWSVVSGQLSVVSGQLSVVSCQLSVVSGQEELELSFLLFLLFPSNSHFETILRHFSDPQIR